MDEKKQPVGSPKKLLRVVWLLSVGGLLLMAFARRDDFQTWNRDGDFALPTSAIIGEDVKDVCLSLAPWGAESWGVEAASFNSEDATLTGARFAQFGENLYLYGKQEAEPEDFSLGLVRAIQGNIWQDKTLCDEPIPWYVPHPLPLSENLQLALDYRLDTANLLTQDTSWLMVAVNVWVSSPDFPPGDDGRGNKPLVLDLVLYHHCNSPDCVLENFEDEAAFHYQAIVTDNVLRIGHPLEWRAALLPQIQRALDADYICREGECTGIPAVDLATVSLYQLEFVIEMRNAEGAALIDNFHLMISPDDTQTESQTP